MASGPSSDDACIPNWPYVTTTPQMNRTVVLFRYGYTFFT